MRLRFSRLEACSLCTLVAPGLIVLVGEGVWSVLNQLFQGDKIYRQSRCGLLDRVRV